MKEQKYPNGLNKICDRQKSRHSFLSITILEISFNRRYTENIHPISQMLLAMLNLISLLHASMIADV